MTKYELSLTKDYVPGWTLVDAVRELFQNALDQQTVVPNNEMFWNYNRDTQILQIGNKSSVLEPTSLLLGASTKAADRDTIGQFGEGYKVAALVLTRLNKKLTILNYGAKEVWHARFSKSKKYKSEILVFDVFKKSLWERVPDHDLTIEISNITQEEFKGILESNLHMQDAYDYFDTKFGQILTNEQYQHKVYVNGLYVCDYEPYVYGYNFLPAHIKLDRDRKLVSDFHLRWLASDMWMDQTDPRMIELAAELSAKGAADVAYLTSVYTGTDNKQKIAKQAFNNFREQHGKNAVPITNQDELRRVPPSHMAIIVEPKHKELMENCVEYEHVLLDEPDTLHGKVTAWLEEWRHRVQSDMAIQELEGILYEYKD